MFSTLTTLLGLATAVFAATIDVKVGDGGLVFDPNSVTAQVGDSVRFQFYSGRGSHSVVLSSFDTPCQPATDGFYSGIIQGNQEGNHTFTISITSTSPQWYYCSVGSHCQSGMVGVINPPAASPSNDGQDITAFASAAQAVLRQTPPGSIQGGVIATDDSAPSSSASSSGSGLTPASPRPSLTASTTTAGGETVTSSGTSTTGGSSTGPASTTMSESASASSSGASTTTPPSGTGSGTGSGTEAGSSETAATTTTSGGRRSEWSVVLWLSVILGGLVALMA
ncbi:Cupredoxin [Cadophora sp. MPI-SDFR-AT-0126]|nr:Cupredoxin [Leotiomycetes sp. MPI-SDFR-AT-0126]